MFGVGFLPYPSVFDKTFSTHYFNGGKQEKMKKRLLSMLMAVLMIVSLVPAVALADGSNCEHKNVSEIVVEKNATAKQPGITAKVCKDCGEVEWCNVTPFVTKRNYCTTCTNPVTVEVQKATCTEAGLTVTYCGTCGQPIDGIAAKGEAALGHDYAFTVVVKPTCNKDGWGYAQCKVCGEPIYVANAAAAVELLPADAEKEDVAAVEALFAMTNKGHKDTKALTTVTEKVVDKDGKTIATPAVAATHVETIYGIAVALDKDGNLVSEIYGTVPTGAGKEADKICADCNYVLPGKTLDGLNDAHKSAMKVIKEGEQPYRDKDDNDAKVDGVTDVVYCAICNKTFGGTTISYDKWNNVKADNVPGVTTEIRNAKDATCEVAGYTGDTYTWVMTKPATKDTEAEYGFVLSQVGTEIPALGHHFVAVEGKAPTCTEAGYNYNGYYKCDRVDKDGDPICNATKGNSYQIPVPALGHKMTVKVLVEATCQHQGLNVYACSVCNTPLKNEDGNIAYYTAKVDHVAADELANVVAATCTEAGYSGDQVCKWCGETLKKGEEVPALGHKTEVKDAKAATCTEAGYTGDEVCTVCGETVKKGTEIPALGHKFENGVCTVCGAADPNYVVPNPFKDVAKTSPYYDAIIWAAKEEITTGKTADTFGIDEGCTRAQIVTFLYRAAGSPEVKADTVNPFTDVSKDSVYYNAILWAVENGITKGTTDTTFDPNAVCTRGQIVTFLFRASGAEKVATGTNFADVAAGSYCADAVAWAVANKVANGFADGSFRPEATCTRGQAVTFIFRALAK
jgi:hypothetical protein